MAVDLAPAQFGFHAAADLRLTVTPGDLDAIGTALSLDPETMFMVALPARSLCWSLVTCRDTEDLYTFITTKIGVLPVVRQVEVVPVPQRRRAVLLSAEKPGQAPAGATAGWVRY